MPVLDAQRREKERAIFCAAGTRAQQSLRPAALCRARSSTMLASACPSPRHSAAPVTSSSPVALPAIPWPNPSGLSYIAAAAIAAAPSTVAVACSTIHIGDSDPHLAQLPVSSPSPPKMHST
ncbi:hypothetical protein HK405_001352 [Cladochytrium tenue]|nr:hypothetical protein HK405_001352 [Cladochytrium tenue]